MHGFKILRFLPPFQFVGIGYHFLVSWKYVCRSQGNCKSAVRMTFINAYEMSAPLAIHARPYGDFKDIVRDRSSTVQFLCQVD